MKTQEKLSELVSTSTSCNSVVVFENVGKMESEKKLENVGNGGILAREAIVKNGLHFSDSDEIEGDNVKLVKRLSACEDVAEVSLDSLGELIMFIDKISL